MQEISRKVSRHQAIAMEISFHKKRDTSRTSILLCRVHSGRFQFLLIYTKLAPPNVHFHYLTPNLRRSLWKNHFVLLVIYGHNQYGRLRTTICCYCLVMPITSTFYVHAHKIRNYHELILVSMLSFRIFVSSSCIAEERRHEWWFCRMWNFQDFFSFMDRCPSLKHQIKFRRVQKDIIWTSRYKYNICTALSQCRLWLRHRSYCMRHYLCIDFTVNNDLWKYCQS